MNRCDPITIITMRPEAEHKSHPPQSIRCFVLTVSDTRNEQNDTSGDAIADMLRAAGHQVIGRTIVKDDPIIVRDVVLGQIVSGEVQLVVTTGGTGITSRDMTYEAISSLLEKRLDGFGELFRMLSYAEIGAAAMFSRATAGLAHGCIIAALPGAEAAVRLAMKKLLIPELEHLIQQANK
jgi:molybdenum cofactor biosynthesis protein B